MVTTNRMTFVAYILVSTLATVACDRPRDGRSASGVGLASAMVGSSTGAVTKFEYAFKSIPEQDRPCEQYGLKSIDPLGLWEPIPLWKPVDARESGTFQTPQGKYLVFGYCFDPMKAEGKVPALFRFNANNLMDKSYSPQFIDAPYGCLQTFSTEANGSIFWGVLCATTRKYRYHTFSLYKFNSEGELDKSFSTRGVWNVGSDVATAHFSYLPDGTGVLSYYKVEGLSEYLVGFDLNTGKILNEADIKHKSDHLNHFLLQSGTIIEHKSNDLATPIQGVTFNVKTFVDLLNRTPIVVPRIFENTLSKPSTWDRRGFVFLNGYAYSFLSPAGGSHRLAVTRFVDKGGYELEPDIGFGDSTRTLKGWRYSKKFSDIAEGEAIYANAWDLNVSVKTIELKPSSPMNTISCQWPIEWKGDFLLPCSEFALDGSYVGLNIMVFNSDFNLNINFGDRGVYRIKDAPCMPDPGPKAQPNWVIPGPGYLTAYCTASSRDLYRRYFFRLPPPLGTSSRSVQL